MCKIAVRLSKWIRIWSSGRRDERAKRLQKAGTKTTLEAKGSGNHKLEKERTFLRT